MPKNIKQCKGFDESICEKCKRKNRFEKNTLVSELSEYEGTYFCNHYIHYKSK